ncbi:MAG: copper homeostasis protein CutC [Rubellimicrobium sp.]|nr:copper homeostasis protein CutC [Rubellimicrobium sp.]
MILEVCIDGPEGLLAAHEGGADRVELCAALSVGGLSPAVTLVRMAADLDMPGVAMIRPRPGDFVWSAAEVAFMEREIDLMQEMGVLGVVIGASRPDGRLDDAVLRRLLAGVDEGREAVLHRAFDLAPDPFEALEMAVDLGFDRILTSGGAVRAADALPLLRRLVDRARDRLTILPGSGITPANAGAILEALGVDEIHASCAQAVPQMPLAVTLGFAAAERRETAAAGVRALRAAINGRA